MLKNQEVLAKHLALVLRLKRIQAIKQENIRLHEHLRRLELENALLKERALNKAS